MLRRAPTSRTVGLFVIFVTAVIIGNVLPYLDWLTESLAAKLAEKPIGETVALRGDFELTSDHGLLSPSTASAVAMAARWFDAGPLKVYAQGGPDQSYVSVLATFAGGQTALLVSGLLRDGAAPSARLLVIGNHGTMNFQDRPGNDTLAVDLAPTEGNDVQRIAARIEQSLRAGKPVAA
jgi:hypothetical protein